MYEKIDHGNCSVQNIWLEHGKTTVLLLQLTDSVAHSGRVVTESGFCVLLALIKLASVGVFASAVIKKRRYWPKYIDAGAIDSHFDANGIDTTDSLPGVMDGTQFRIYCVKEEDYVMKLMATYGALRLIEEGKTQQSKL